MKEKEFEIDLKKDIENAIDCLVFELADSSTTNERKLAIRAELASLTETYKVMLTSEDCKIQSKTSKTNTIIGAVGDTVKTVLSIGSSFVLAAMCFGYETSGNGSIFTQTGRTTIGNIFKNK